MDILDAVSKKTELKKVASTKGGEYAGPCPSCGGTDRFRCWPADKGGEGSFWCRGCEKGGDLVQWFVDFCGMEYRKAFREAGRAPLEGYTSKRYQPMHSSAAAVSAQTRAFKPRHYDDPVETWELKAGALVDKSHARLLENERILGWLAGRGLDLAAVKAFSLGWFSGERDKPCMFRPRTSWGLPEILKANGRPKMLWIPRGIVIPWVVDGKIRRIKIRRPVADLGKKGVKYYFLPGSSAEPALLNPDRKAFVVVESELDAMLIVAKVGGQVGALALGSAGNKPGTGSFHRLQDSLRILNALDSDTAGENASKWWAEQFDNVSRWPVPQGKDPGEAFAMGTDIRDWVAAGLPPRMTLKLRHDPGSVVQSTPKSPPVGDAQVEDIPVDPDNVVHPEPEANPVTTPVTTPEGDWLPESIHVLRDLLERYPVKVICTSERTAIVSHPDFHNDAVIGELSNLVYWDDSVNAFLECHPDGAVHRGNFEAGL